MTSSIVRMNICRITEKFYITCEQLGSPYVLPGVQAPPPERPGEFAGRLGFSLYSDHLYYNPRHQFAHPPQPSPATKISCF